MHVEVMHLVAQKDAGNGVSSKLARRVQGYLHDGPRPLQRSNIRPPRRRAPVTLLTATGTRADSRWHAIHNIDRGRTPVGARLLIMASRDCVDGSLHSEMIPIMCEIGRKPPPKPVSRQG